MNAAQARFWERRVLKEDTSLLRRASEVHQQVDGNSSSRRHQQQPPLSARSQCSSLTATTTAAAAVGKNINNKPEENKAATSAAPVPRIPINLPHRENRALKLLPKEIPPPATLASNGDQQHQQQLLLRLPLTRDVLEERSLATRSEAEERKKKREETGSAADQQIPLSARSSQISHIMEQREKAKNKARGVHDSSSSSEVGKWVSSVPSHLPAIGSSRGSTNASESAFSRTTLSHHAASTALISGVTSINARLEAIEKRVEGEKELRNELRRALLEVRAIVEKSKQLQAAGGAASTSLSVAQRSSSSNSARQRASPR